MYPADEMNCAPSESDVRAYSNEHFAPAERTLYLQNGFAEGENSTTLCFTGFFTYFSNMLTKGHFLSVLTLLLVLIELFRVTRM